MKTAFEIINETLKKELDIISDEKIEEVSNAIAKNLGLDRLKILSFSGPEYNKIESIVKLEMKGDELENYLVYGNTASGKTTKLIRMINTLLQANPEFKIGVCENYPEIKNAIPKILSVQKPSADLDLFVCTSDYYMIEAAYNMEIPVWCEIQGDEKTIATAKQNLPCLKDFKELKMRILSPIE